MNHRPLQKQYLQKHTVKHQLIPDVIADVSVDIHQINLSDRDKFGKIIYKGSGTGGGHKKLPLDESVSFRGHFKKGSRKIKKGKHPQAVEYSKYLYVLHTGVKYKRNNLGSIIKATPYSCTKIIKSGKARRILINV